jgi:GntR family transcriptional regulator/MocR family aminotransferase
MHIAWHLAEELPRAAELQALAAGHGVGIYTVQSGAAHDFGGCRYSGRTIVLGFSSLNEGQIRIGIERIAAAVDGLPVPGRAASCLMTPTPVSFASRQSIPLAGS